MFAAHRHRRRLGRWLPPLRVPDHGPMPRAFSGLPLREQLVALTGVVRSQLPNHNPAHVRLPALADMWFRRYDDGYDVSHWYTAELAEPT